MMKFMFILAAVSTLPFAYFDKGAAGMVMSLFFLLAGAYFSKPRFKKNDS
ncbi:hypothetical protein GCM10010954_16240 [Halobacillus andaensis]|uniref:Uncharacterized protein n=1 Tax=Halobacillus andaensis TaxID=1176239 RepID=A0A917B2Z5_HALAA|nr:hypothetical protein [Halobacillus andaensis]MBP2004874.1 hypothetical protein [Halobacillus andaensis]GGF18256.1 hypothetical protein GCM10010954_16240 [Halobacillus andaensis]